jgi:rhodanese-related sulfurtransferase
MVSGSRFGCEHDGLAGSVGAAMRNNMTEGKRQYRPAAGLARFLAWICPPCAGAMRRPDEVPRIAVKELCARMARGDRVVVLDVRHPLDTFGDPRLIPGAIRVRPQDLAWGKVDFTANGGIVIYCAMENEAASEHAARLLKRRGFRDVRVVAGGFATWRDTDLPLIEPRTTDGDDAFREQRSACQARFSAEHIPVTLQATEVA